MEGRCNYEGEGEGVMDNSSSGGSQSEAGGLLWKQRSSGKLWLAAKTARHHVSETALDCCGTCLLPPPNDAGPWILGRNVEILVP